jgi:hypothetical protein
LSVAFSRDAVSAQAIAVTGNRGRLPFWRQLPHPHIFTTFSGKIKLGTAHSNGIFNTP